MNTVFSLNLLLMTALVAPAAAVESGKPKEPTVPAGQSRSDKALKGGQLSYWDDRPDQARPMAATFIGGKGHEWLCAGAFQANGTIVLAGNVCGGEFELPIKDIVLGSDGERPAPATFKTEIDKKGRSHTEKPGWTRPDATGFIVFATPDLKTMTKAVRLPWLSGAITSMALGKDGAIYIAGRPGPNVGKLGGKQQTLTIPVDAERKTAQAEAAFIAKLSSDASTVEWVHAGQGKTDAPDVIVKENGQIVFKAQDLRVFDPNGNQISATTVPGGLGDASSVSPIDGTLVRGGDRNTGTGREPWRCPLLRVMEPDGKLRFQLYEWPASYVVLDNSRAVSDTAVVRVKHDNDGNLLLQLWSDGGNSVAGAQPTDIRRGAGTSGLGLTAAGAGAMSFSYIVKVEPKDYQIIGWTMWIGRYAGKPNSTAIDEIAYGDDGSVLFTGGAAWGLIQTSNKLANGEPAGNYIAILTPDMSGVRFSSTIPGLVAAELGSGQVAIGHGVVNGKPRALFVGGANKDQEVYGLVTATPTLNAVQPTFGGGQSDGYVVMVDLSSPTPLAKPTPPVHVPRRQLITNLGLEVGRKPNPEKNPSTSTEFEFSPTVPKWNHADAEFRVADASYWPNFVAGRPESGSATWSESGVKGSFTTVLNTWAQPNGKQDRRVLGQLYNGETPPALTFAVESFGAKITESGSFIDNKGNTKERVVECQPLTATLTLGGTSVKLPFKAVGYRGKVTESQMQRLEVIAFATVKGSVLGLKGDLAGKDIDIRISTQGIDSQTAGAKKK